MNAVRERAIAIGAIFAFMILVGAVGALFGGRAYLRHQSGEAAAERILAEVVAKMTTSYRTRGKLCEDGEDGKTKSVGFACPANDEASYYRLYTVGYERRGDHVVLLATRSPTFDPNHVFARFERRGEVRGGEVVFDPELYVVR